MTSNDGAIFAGDRHAFEAAYPDGKARLTHRLVDHPSFALEALAGLADRLPLSSLEWNRGDLGIEQDPGATPTNGLTPAETIRQIETCRSWIVLKNVEQDRVYGDLLAAALSEIEPVARTCTGAMHARQGYIFVSSGDAVTPFHMDPEHNILMQLRGEKTMTVYDRALLTRFPADRHEGFHAGEAHRNLPYDPAYEDAAEPVRLQPGEAVYVPVKAPHRVQNGAGVSVSFSITWRSAASVREAQLHRANGYLRKRGGHPPFAGANPARDALAVYAWRAGVKMGLLRE